MCALALSSCSSLPSNGPSTNAIVTGAAVAQNDVPSGKSIFDYALVDISKAIITYLTDPGAGSLQASFGMGHGLSGQLKIGNGDVVQVTIFESGAGGLFIPNDAGSRPGNYVTLPNETVDGNGYISVPYAGQIKAGGRTISDIQDDIVKKLVNRALEPQVIVSQVSQSGNQVTVVGEVRSPGKFPLNTAGDRVLDAIARAGGISHPGYETYLTLERHKKRSTIWFDAIIRNPDENIFMQPDDTLYVYQIQRGFTAFGATGASAQFKFDAPTIYLADAVGKAGGLIDTRADPGQVFLYRREDRETLIRMGVDISTFDPKLEKIPTIFRTNFRDPTSFFAAQKFPMRDQDVIYVSNADKVELEKFLGLITDVPIAAGSVADNVSAVQSARILLKQ
jgi:polysaccharide export outer membrane protein